jgi:PEP-CTERM motif
MKSRIIRAAILLTVAITGERAFGDLVLDLKFSDGSTSKVVNSGDTVFVDLLISDTDASTPLIAEGLLTGGGRLMKQAGAVSLIAGAITDPDSLWSTGLFDTNPASAGGAAEIAKVLGSTDLFLGPAAGQGSVSMSIRLARFAIQAVGVATQNATIVADILGVGFVANTTFTSLTDLDGAITSFGSVNLTIAGGSAAVPEPGSLLLCGLTAAFGGGALWRRRRSRTQSAV